MNNMELGKRLNEKTKDTPFVRGFNFGLIDDINRYKYRLIAATAGAAALASVMHMTGEHMDIDHLNHTPAHTDQKPTFDTED